MKPIEQTLLGHPEGNCFGACLASILELPLDEVPNFKGDLWRFRFNEWLRPRGVAIVTLALPNNIEAMKPFERQYFLPGYCILAAESPRFDCLHAVVCLDGVVVHDPHPQRDMGLGAWKEVDLLVALDASRVEVTS